MLKMERFQAAYGWLTNWDKSMAYLLNGTGNNPTSIVFQSVSVGPDVDPMKISEHEVTLVCNKLEFLQTCVDDPGAHFREL